MTKKLYPAENNYINVYIIYTGKLFSDFYVLYRKGERLSGK